MNIKRILSAASIAVVFGLLLSASSQAQEHRFVGTKQCKMCHNKADEGKQYTVWKSMKHSRAYTALLGDRAREIAAERGLPAPPNESAECLKCHVTAYDAETKSLPRTVKLVEGVQCESCHGPASDHLADGKVLRMAAESTINVLDNIVRPNAETCLKCHNDENPTWDPEKYTLPDGSKAGFNFEQAYKKIQHSNPKKAK